MKTVMEENKYYCLHISKVCMLFVHIMEVDSDKGYFISSYRPNKTDISTCYWHSHDFQNKCISDVSEISKELYDSVEKIRRVRKTLSASFGG